MNLALYSQMFVSDGIVNEFPVMKLLPEKVVDTNGAGDAFVGGEFASNDYCFGNSSVLVLYHMDMQVLGYIRCLFPHC
jgi:hypothetical protein